MIQDATTMDRPVSVRRLPRRWIAIGAGAILLGAVGLAFPTLLRWARADRAVDGTSLRYGTVTRGDLERDLSLQSRVVAALSPTLFASGPGIVTLRVQAGAKVAKGDVLAIIDSPELRAGLEQARAELATARAERDRQNILGRQSGLRARQQVDLLTVRLEAAERQKTRMEELAAEGLSSKSELEAARDAAQVASLELEQAKKELGFSQETEGFEVATRDQGILRQESVTSELQKRVDALTIHAPIDGMVATVAVQDRDAVVANQAVLSVVNLSSLELRIGLPEEYAAETSIGTPAAISFLGREYPGKVTAISPEVIGNELQATVAFDGAVPEGLRQNQKLTTRLLFESRKNVLKVPRGAFLESEGSRAAYVVSGRTALRRDITTGAGSVGEIEIVSGLKEGETIVLSDTKAFGRASNIMLR